ncbi:MAG: lytic murein transglycosylase B [Gammaproteobacteria bacterium]|nr:lytic murein transglycosylase B [Gammaproteobacteria bacterium]
MTRRQQRFQNRRAAHLLVLLFATLFALPIRAAGLDAQQVELFALEMEHKHGFDATAVKNVLNLAVKLDSVLATMARPAESKPWSQYRPLFLSAERIRAGVEFWNTYATALDDVSTQYGVPPEIVVAIIGVETFYGRNMGNYRVLDALGTLAFHFPARGAFFRSELEQFLLLTRAEQLDPVTPRGSYAGAMGFPQFMPSSFLRFAVDFDHDGHRDIWRNPVDAIGSVASYLHAHGWRAAEPVTMVAEPSNWNENNSSTKVELKQTIAEYASAGSSPRSTVAPNAPAVLLAYAGAEGNEYWFALNNFYVITRYNHSPKYALAVYQLAEAIRDMHTQKTQ